MVSQGLERRMMGKDQRTKVRQRKVFAVATFGEKLKKLRKQRDWSQDELGRRIDIHGRHVGKYESNQVLPNAETVLKIGRVLGVSLDYLLKDEYDLEPVPDQGFNGTPPLRDPKLVRLFESLEDLKAEDKRVVASLIEAFIKKRQIEEILQR